MSRQLLFLAGEWSVSMPLVFSSELWGHTMTSRPILLNSDGSFHRQGVTESLKGFIYFASVDNEEVRQHNLTLLSALNVPCWPDPKKLLNLDNRHVTLKMCVDAGLVSHPVQQVHLQDQITLPFPYVIKTGNSHQGEGKHLVESESDKVVWGGIASAEPFFNGKSCRVLFIDNDVFCIHFFNSRSWIKNSAGADLLVGTLPNHVIDHARKVKDLFGLEVCGIDYVIRGDEFHFLEWNCFPGVSASDEIEASAKKLFRKKMTEIEKRTGI